jgi:hypothetical protein
LAPSPPATVDIKKVDAGAFLNKYNKNETTKAAFEFTALRVCVRARQKTLTTKKLETALLLDENSSGGEWIFRKSCKLSESFVLYV